MNMNEKKFWDDYWTYVITNQKYDKLDDNFILKYEKAFSNLKDKNALDLGCGIGTYSKYLIDNGFNVTACDYSKKALDKLKELELDCKIVECDISKPLPFSDNSFDLVIANMSIHYFNMEDTKSIFEEIHRILKKDGLFIGRVNSNKNEQYKTKDEIEPNYYYENGRYRRLFDQEQFDIFTKDYEVITLKEDVAIRLDKTKALWEFVLKK